MNTSTGNSPWEPPSPEELHAMLPQYEITAILGRGGMGAVYKGRQAKLNRDVAIKLLPETLAEGDDELNFVARFEQEAQAMANLDHPAIVSVHDFGETAAGQCYFVMEFIDGMDIHQYLQANGGQLSQEHAIAITSHVLDALEYAHGRGIIHRDIKPANVLLNQEGRVKIADFGLAKKIADDGDDSPGLTMSNVALGTPDFVAPESIDGSRIPDHRADLYAVGVMLYQMLTGILPRGQFKTPSEHRPELDFRLDEIVSRAMQYDPDDRYGSATEIRTDLDLVANAPVTKVEVIEDEDDAPASVPEKMVTPAKKSKAGLWTGVAVGAVVVAVLAMVLMPANDEKEQIAPTVVEPEPTVVEAEEPAPAPAKAEPVAVVKIEEPEPPAPAAVVVAESPKEAKPEPVVEEKPVVAEVKVEPTEVPALIPELEIRLNGYLAARQKAVLDLAAKYEGALTARTNTAADAGDLPLVKAFRAEAKHVANLKKDLAANDGDLTDRVNSTATLPDLATDAHTGLAQLRETWTKESAKINSALDTQLQQSLVAAEKQLTKAREFDKAEVILTFRQSLSAPLAPAEPKPAPVQTAASDSAEMENPFGWKPIPDDLFPIPIPKRSTTPCRMVAFRADGAPVDEAHFREVFGGVPSEFGDIVDLDIWPGVNKSTYRVAPTAIRTDGTVVSWLKDDEINDKADELQDVVRISVGNNLFVALRGDGTVVTARRRGEIIDREGIDFDAAKEWKNIVQVSAGALNIAGITAGGEPRVAGDNSVGQQNFPADWQSDIFAIDIGNVNNSAILAKKADSGTLIEVFGAYPNEISLKKKERFFLTFQPFLTDSSGRLESDNMQDYFPHSIAKLKSKPRDIVWMSRADYDYTSEVGITTACNGDGEWTFWGSAGDLGDFDPSYCEKEAAGAWKALVRYPYVLTLKPVSRLTPDDWTGAGAVKVEPPAPQTTAKPKPAPIQTNATNSAGTENPFGWKPFPDETFPIPIPKRQTTPCRVVAFRMDAKPVDDSAFREAFGGVPDDMGEVVDFEAYNSIAHESISRYFTFNPIALRADGSCTAMRWKEEVEAARDQLTDVVAMDMGWFSFMALRGDGTPVAVGTQSKEMKAEKIDYDEVADWKNIVRISAGNLAVGGVTSGGEPKLAGDNRLGQADVPEDLRQDIVDVDVKNSSGMSILVQKKSDGFRIAKFSRYPSETEIGRNERYLLDFRSMFADSRGRPTTEWLSPTDPHTLEKLGRTNLRDVIQLVRAEGGTGGLGITAVCEENDRWTFWGNADEVGGFDPDYCAERAEGSWKLFMLYPYVLALKPVSELTPEDWTGAGPAKPASPVKEAPSAPPAAAKAQFPLPIPIRPTFPGHVIVLRRDGKPLDPMVDHPVTTLPEELDSGVVQIAVSQGSSGMDDGDAFAVALMEDGKVRMWGGPRDRPETTEQLADQRKFRASNIVQVSAGPWCALFLDEKGSVFGSGGGLGISLSDGLERIRLAEKAVDISIRSGLGVALLENGELVELSKEPKYGILKQLPPSIGVETVFGGVSLGEDLVWRSWLTENRAEISGEFPSEGLIGEPSAFANFLIWIGGDGKVRANYVDRKSNQPDNFHVLHDHIAEVADPVAVRCGSGILAAKSASAGWVIADMENKNVAEPAAAVKNAISLDFSKDYIFALMPGEKKE